MSSADFSPSRSPSARSLDRSTHQSCTRPSWPGAHIRLPREGLCELPSRSGSGARRTPRTTSDEIRRACRGHNPRSRALLVTPGRASAAGTPPAAAFCPQANGPAASRVRWAPWRGPFPRAAEPPRFLRSLAMPPRHLRPSGHRASCSRTILSSVARTLSAPRSIARSRAGWDSGARHDRGCVLGEVERKLRQERRQEPCRVTGKGDDRHPDDPQRRQDATGRSGRARRGVPPRACDRVGTAPESAKARYATRCRPTVVFPLPALPWMATSPVVGRAISSYRALSSIAAIAGKRLVSLSSLTIEANTKTRPVSRGRSGSRRSSDGG